MSAKGHRVFAAVYDRLNAGAERTWLGKRRADLVARATGQVLEIGAGTGANLAHYRDVERVVAAEPDPAMRARLRSRLDRAAVPVKVSDAPAEHLGLRDASIDTVVCTLVLCSVADPDATLAELRRVLRPGGQLLVLEHVRGEGRRARWQDRVTPLWRRVGAGCHPNRDTVAAIERAGFHLEHQERFDPPRVPAIIRPFVEVVAGPGSWS
ncbi:MAG: class I SAM-dependent methyltransferase [Actinomycetota bacterium]|jgi:ubiquinone/menaquinone biosynthesis C-methylase UbiE|nr:class I SAM-dependent methyltransferase [Actinomycetota bacterium]